MQIDEEEQKTARKGDVDKTTSEGRIRPNIEQEPKMQIPFVRIKLVSKEKVRRLGNKSVGSCDRKNAA